MPSSVMTLPSARPLSTAVLISVHLSFVVPSSALTDARSVLLNIFEIRSVLSWSVMSSIASFSSPKIWSKGRRFPSASYACTPRSSHACAAASVVGFIASRIFRRCVPASDPLIPLSASAPRTEESSAVPPFTDFALPPMVRKASPNCSTEVFVVEDAFAI